MAKYEYYDTANKLQTVEAASSDEALSSAKDLGKSSGVALVQPKVKNVKTSVSADKVGKGSIPDVPAPTQSGAGADLAYSIGSSMPGVQDAKNAAAAFATAPTALETELRSALTTLKQGQESLLGKSKRQGELMESEGVNANRELLNKYTQQLEQEQRAVKKTTDALYEGEAGFMTAGYADKKIQDIQRRSLSKQADIAILGNAAQGNIETALNLVDQKLKMEYGDIEAKIQNQKDLIQTALPLMSLEQQREAQNRQNELSLYTNSLQEEQALKRMDYQAKIAREQAAFEASLKPADTSSIVGVSGTPTENADLWAENIASLTGGNTEKGRQTALLGLERALETGGEEGFVNLARSKFVKGQDKPEQDAYNAAEAAMQQSKKIDEFLAENPDFKINFAKKKINDITGIFGKRDPKVVEFLSLTSFLDSKLRVVDTGLSLTGFELNDSQKRFYSESDTVESYLVKKGNIEDKVVNGIRNGFNTGIGEGFYEAYSSNKPYLTKQEQGSDVGRFESEYDAYQAPSAESASNFFNNLLFGR